MKKMKIFYGPAQSGKTKCAREMAVGKRVYWMTLLGENEIKSPYLTGMHEGVDMIVIDDVPAVLLRDVMEYFFNLTLIIKQKGRPAFEMPHPEIIIITDTTLPELPSDESTLRCYDFIQFGNGDSKDINPVDECKNQLPSAKCFYYFSFKVNKKKIKGKVEAHNHREAWQKVLLAVDTLEKLGGLNVTDITIPKHPERRVDLSQLVNQ